MLSDVVNIVTSLMPKLTKAQLRLVAFGVASVAFLIVAVQGGAAKTVALAAAAIIGAVAGIDVNGGL